MCSAIILNSASAVWVGPSGVILHWGLVSPKISSSGLWTTVPSDAGVLKIYAGVNSDLAAAI